MENEMKNEESVELVGNNLKVNISSREKLKGNIDFAKVVVTDISSGEVVSTKRIVLLAD